MSRKSAPSRTIRKSVMEIPSTSPADLDRLRAAMAEPVDTSDIPERRPGQRLQRDANGRILPRKSIIREAVTEEMRRRGLTAYRLWQIARTHYPTLSQAAVHEFLKGQRQLELPSVEALLVAVNLRVVQGAAAGHGRNRTTKKRPAAARAG
jgi:hypothetical protein